MRTYMWLLTESRNSTLKVQLNNGKITKINLKPIQCKRESKKCNLQKLTDHTITKKISIKHIRIRETELL